MKHSDFYLKFVSEKIEIDKINAEICSLSDKLWQYKYVWTRYKEHLDGLSLRRLKLKDNISERDWCSIEWVDDIELYCSVNRIFPKDLIEAHIKLTEKNKDAETNTIR